MQNLYRVTSKYYVSQVQTDFEYSWFVYQRSQNNQVAEQAISGKNQVAVANLSTKVINELFTFEEACQLQIVLETFFAAFAETVQITTTIEEITACSDLDELCSLEETYQAKGEFVDPYDFATLDCNTLGFLVAAAVHNQTHYVADDFLGNLSPARLEALRQMHLECNG